MTVPKISNFHQMCRGCLCSSSTLKPLFDDSNLANSFQSLTTIKVSPNDGLPSSICLTCKRSLEESISFKMMCLTSNVKLNTVTQIQANQKESIENSSSNCDGSLINKIKIESTDEFHWDELINVLEKGIEQSSDKMDNNQTSVNMLDPAEIKLEKDELEILDMNGDIKIIERPPDITKIIERNTINLSKNNKTDLSKRMAKEIFQPCKGDEEELEWIDVIEMPEMDIVSVKVLNKKRPENNRKRKSTIAVSCSECSKQFSSDKALMDHTKNAHKVEIKENRRLNETYNAPKKHTVEKLQSFKINLATGNIEESQHNESTEPNLKIIKISLNKNEFMTTPSCLPKYKGKPYKCNQCSASFLSNSNLYQHKQLHMNQSKYHCDLCLKVFNQLSDIKSHMKMHAENIDTLKCRFCLKKFEHVYGLSRHLQTHAAKVFACNLCSKTFKNANYLAKHLIMHKTLKEYKCVTCLQIFLHKKAYVTHKYLSPNCN